MRGKSGESLRFQEFAPMATERKQEVIALKFVDTGIIDRGQGVEFTKLAFESGLFLRIRQRRQGAQINIHRVEGVDRNGVVGVGIGVLTRERGVVDGEYLQHALSGDGHPVDHRFEIAKVAHTLAALTTQGEHGDSGTGHARREGFEIHFDFGQDVVDTLFRRCDFQTAVFTTLPMYHSSRAFVHGYKFVFATVDEQTGVERQLPHTGIDFVEGHCGILVPRAERGRGTEECEVHPLSA